MEFLLFDIIQAGFGRLYLFIRYRKKELINIVLEEKYEGSYSNAGKLLSLSFFAVLFGVLIIGFLGSVFITSLK
ncbi:hypothetical protein C1N53_04275 [Pontibacter sp. SGAir0037]|nr:hypothetical protein C1N53_04275 [Pontibacter sp. SGAir0037]